MSKRYSREKLIDEVKNYPVLYDTKHQHHRDIDVRDRCWQEISERIGANSESLKREWKILRDSLRQALKRTTGVGAVAGGGAGAGEGAGEGASSMRPGKKWRFQNRMSFILPYVTVRGRRIDQRDIKVDESEEQSDLDQEQNRDTEVWDSGYGGGGGGGSGGDGDALDLFFASVCQSTKRLPRKHQAIVKRQVLDVLLRVEEDAAEADDAKPFSELS